MANVGPTVLFACFGVCGKEGFIELVNMIRLCLLVLGFTLELVSASTHGTLTVEHASRVMTTSNNLKLIEVVAKMESCVHDIAIDVESGRLFFTSVAGQLFEWNHTAEKQQVFPGSGFQKELKSSPIISVDNLRHWLFVLDHDQQGGGGSKISTINLAEEEEEDGDGASVIQRYHIPDSVSKSGLFTSMVIDPRSQFLFLADSVNGGIVVVDIHVWKSWRLLDQHESTQARPGGSNGKLVPPMWANRLSVSSLAVDQRGQNLIYGAIFGNSLHTVPLKTIKKQPPLTFKSLEHLQQKYHGPIEQQVNILGNKTASSGIVMNQSSGTILMADVETASIVELDPTTTNSSWSTIVQDRNLFSWPTGMIISGDYLYIANCGPGNQHVIARVKL